VDGRDVLTFARLLRKLRTDAGFTLEELAFESDVGVRTIGDLERGATRRPHKAIAEKIARALGLDGPDLAAFMEASRGHVLRGVPAATEVPAPARALPPDTRAFTGREAELRQLADPAGVYAISGMAGTGKTTLAVHAAHRLASGCPDGQISLSLHGHTPGRGPVQPVDALASLLHIAGKTASQIPDDLESRIGAWRTYLAGKRMLLLLDDAADSEQVLPLLPGTSESMVIVTSRRRLTELRDARLMNLGILHADEAAEMLVNLTGRPDVRLDASVRELARLCGYLPLAMGLMASKLASHPAWSAGQMVVRLTAARSRLDLMQGEKLSVAGAFDLSYRDLTPAQQRMFRGLGSHPGTDIDAYAAAALDDTDPDSAGRVLDALYEYSLLSEWPSGRYVLHDLIHEHARALAAADEGAGVDGAMRRLLDYYLHTARVADRYLARRTAAGVPVAITAAPAFAPSLSTLDEAIAWMEAERGNLHDAAEYAASRGFLDHAIAIPSAMHSFMISAGYWAEAMTLQHVALSAAGDAGDDAAAADALTDLTRLRYTTGDFTGGFGIVAGALEMQRRLGNKLGEANALCCLAQLQYATGDYKGAAESLTESLDLCRELADRIGEARARYILGVVEYETGKYPVAIDSLTEALGLFRRRGHRLGEAGAVAYLGAVQRETGDYPSSIANQKESVRLYRLLKDRHEEAGALYFLGAVQYLIGDYAEADTNLNAALDIYCDVGDRFGEAGVRNEIGVLLRLQGDHAAAIESLNHALKLFQDLGSRNGEAEVLGNLGAAQCLAGDHATALGNLNRALQLNDETGNRVGTANVLNSLGELSLKTGTGDALTYHRRALDIAAEIDAALEEARAREGAGQYEYAAGDQAAAIAASRQALKIYQRIGSPFAGRVSAFLESMPPHT
jgi:tetratricopeptide (TPR) repeat protein/transcriptional regulator with XRE-family HTH domain